MTPARRARAIGLTALLALGACTQSAMAPRETAVSPAPRPSGLRPPPAPAPEPAPTGQRSSNSRALATYYARVQNDLLVRGLMRTDGGGPDTQFTDTMLVRNFEAIALREEYARGEGLRPSEGEASVIKKWVQPVRISPEFGASVPPDLRTVARNELGVYARRLAGITGHSISLSESAPNFHVLFVGEDERNGIVPRIRALVPEADPRTLRLFDDLPRSIHCLVIAFSDRLGSFEYARAVAVIRAEHPDLLRQSCIHEEIAQGLGLANDSPRARPSIFNDDDEFALLTEHDAMLLEILYDPALRPGMTPEQALPIVRSLATELVEGGGT
ncbi:DUF2927 domain-containing protein [Citreimonas salinaria]|uniref:DUF2927 domain-containing protein n=1 Tax=Citreimonas salinaria TaxID=321339 RepID=A0A1H3I0S6_9RHOB|nr:DUF2927 domain-containing protein [Citreimonas salinaria]SDY21317.1 Protein of unknown function [Citreimonas salinaria]